MSTVPLLDGREFYEHDRAWEKQHLAKAYDQRRASSYLRARDGAFRQAGRDARAYRAPGHRSLSRIICTASGTRLDSLGQRD